MKNENWKLELSEYIKQGELQNSEKAKTWETAIGLQDVEYLANKANIWVLIENYLLIFD